MRPFEHYEVSGHGSIDFDIYSTDIQLYEDLSDRGERELQISKDKFLGEYSAPPKETLKELLASIKELRGNIAKRIELRMPAIIIEHYEEQVSSLEEKVKNKDFIKHTDKVSLDYKRAHDALSEAFIQSTERKQTLKEIYKYNDEEASKLIDISDEKIDERFDDWLNS
jgi:flagellar biosynthesis chaperone FliJ